MQGCNCACCSPAACLTMVFMRKDLPLLLSSTRDMGIILMLMPRACRVMRGGGVCTANGSMSPRGMGHGGGVCTAIGEHESWGGGGVCTAIGVPHSTRAAPLLLQPRACSSSRVSVNLSCRSLRRHSYFTS